MQPAPTQTPASAGSRAFVFKSGRQDSNLRPCGPEPHALPSCATPRKLDCEHRRILRDLFLEGPILGPRPVSFGDAVTACHGLSRSGTPPPPRRTATTLPIRLARSHVPWVIPLSSSEPAARSGRRCRRSWMDPCPDLPSRSRGGRRCTCRRRHRRCPAARP